MFGSPLPDQPLSGKQSFWDKPGILADKAMIESSLSNEHEKASFLAASVPHSGFWHRLSLPVDSIYRWWGEPHCRRYHIGHDSLCPSHISIRSQGLCLYCPVSCVNMLQEKSPDTRPLMTSSPGLSSLQICRLQRSLSISDNKRPDGLTRLPWQEGIATRLGRYRHLSFGCVVCLWLFSRCICRIGRLQKISKVCQCAQLLHYPARSIWQFEHS